MAMSNVRKFAFGGTEGGTMATQTWRERHGTKVTRGLRAVSYLMVLKGVVGGSIAMLALFGVMVPYLGVEPTIGHEGAAAGFGAVMGALLALKS